MRTVRSAAAVAALCVLAARMAAGADQLPGQDLRLTYRYGGRDFRLTDVAGRVATDILA